MKAYFRKIDHIENHTTKIHYFFCKSKSFTLFFRKQIIHSAKKSCTKIQHFVVELEVWGGLSRFRLKKCHSTTAHIRRRYYWHKTKTMGRPLGKRSAQVCFYKCFEKGFRLRLFLDFPSSSGAHVSGSKGLLYPYQGLPLCHVLF